MKAKPLDKTSQEKPTDARNSEKPVRPFCLEYAEAKNKIFSSINEAITAHNIPMFLLESLLLEAYRSVKDGADAEMKNASAAYEKQMDDYSKVKREGGTPNA